MFRPLCLFLAAAVFLAAAPATPPNGSIETAMKQMSDAMKTLEKGVTPENHAADGLGRRAKVARSTWTRPKVGP